MRGATHAGIFAVCMRRNFNPRTPCGVRHWTTEYAVFHTVISIHAPHAGCDRIAALESTVGGHGISIHAPHAGCDERI